MQRLCFAIPFVLVVSALSSGSAADGTQTASPTKVAYDGPIVDVHLHTDPPDSAIGRPNPVTAVKPPASRRDLRDAVLEACRKHNVVRAVLNGWPGTLDDWIAADPQRFVPAPMILRNTAEPALDVASLRHAVKTGKAGVIGEIIAQYVGLTPDSPVLAPYWALAEELDVPVMIHTGTSFPGTPYAGYPAFRLRFGNPLLLEDVLVKHPRLRVWIAHGGLPWAQETFALMDQYPQVYMDVAVINWITGPRGRPAFHAFLRQAIDRGFQKRIMFGSDQMAWPDAIALAIEGVDTAPFLTPEQKADIFYNNAVNFFRFAK